MKTCAIEDCGKSIHRRSFCCAHYNRFNRHGDPLAGGPLQAAKGEPRRWLESHIDYQGEECLPWPFSKNPDGYGQVQLDGIQMKASRAMTILAHGDPPAPGLHAAHSCGRGHLGCVNPRHLRWATPAENSADRIKHGTDTRGSKSWNALLAESDVIEIREAYATGEFSRKEIAEEVGVSPSVITNIVTRRAWNHI